MNKKLNRNDVEAVNSFLAAIIGSFLIIPTVITIGITILLGGSPIITYAGAVAGSIIYRIFDKEFKRNLKVVYRLWILNKCETQYQTDKMHDAFMFSDWINQKPKNTKKEDSIKNKLNKNILDD